MEERLLKLLDMEQMSSSKFADVIGVQRSSVSHILSGRNKPSFDFLQKTLKAFPYLNADWLILGEGKMYDGEEISSAGNLFGQSFDQEKKDIDSVEKEPDHDEKQDKLSPPELNISDSLKEDTVTSASEDSKVSIPVLDQGANENRILKKVLLIYSDNSFETYNPV